MADRSSDNDQRIWQEALDWVFALDRDPDDPALAAALRAWLSADAAHARAYEEARLIWDLSPRIRPEFAESRRAPAPSAAAPRRPRPGAMAGGQPVRRIGRRGFLAGGAIAAGLSLVALGGGWTALRADYATDVGERKLVTLEDGSRVHLNTDTALRVVYGPEQRRVELLRGEALFDVARDERRPFAVIAGTARIEVLGTRFDTRLDASFLSVLVEEGRVAIGVDGHDVLGGTALTRGEGVRIDLATGNARRNAAKPQEATAWRKGLLIVERWTVAQVLDEIGRYHRGYILLRDDVLAARPVSGVYDLTRPVEAVRAVTRAYGGKVTEISPYLLVVSGR